MKRQKLKIIFIVLTFICASVSAFAQTTPTPKVEEEVLKIESRLVIVPVSVTDDNGQPITGLKAQDFRVAEDNQKQEIAQVSDAEKVPLEIALLFDISASTDSMFQFEQETAAQFLREVMRPEDRATIFTVGENPFMVQARATAENAAIAVKNIQPTKQQTAFYDTVSAAAAYLQKSELQGRRKVLIVISDGEDTSSKGVTKAIWEAERKIVEANISYDELRSIRVKARNDAKLKEQNKVLQSLQNADTVFYAINPAGNSYQLNKMSIFGQSNLQKFADETGGTSFLPKLQPTDLKDIFQNSTNLKKNQVILTKIFRQLINELQAQYLVQYYSEGNFPNNKYVRLDVGLTNPSNARVRARQGYFVKK